MARRATTILTLGAGIRCYLSLRKDITEGAGWTALKRSESAVGDIIQSFSARTSGLRVCLGRKLGAMQKNVTSIVRHLLACACLFVLLPPAQAQTLERGPSSSDSDASPRLEMTAEMGLMGGMVDLSDLHGDPQMGLSGAGADVRVRLTRRVGIGIRGLLAIGGEVTHTQFYDLATIIHLASSGRSRTFLRFGAGGHHEFEDVQEYRQTNQDHSTTVFPAYRHQKLTAPNFLVTGAGITRVLSPRLGITAEVDLVAGPGVGSGAGMRASAGVTLPVGAYRP